MPFLPLTVAAASVVSAAHASSELAADDRSGGGEGGSTSAASCRSSEHEHDGMRHEHEHDSSVPACGSQRMASHAWWQPQPSASVDGAPWQWLLFGGTAMRGPVDGHVPPGVDEEASVAQSGEQSQTAAGGAHQECSRGAPAAATSPAATPRRVLHLFSGPKDLPQGLAALLRKESVEVKEFDTLDECVWLGQLDQLLDDAVYERELSLSEDGFYGGCVEGIPCSTFSMARFRPGGPPVVRRKPDEVRGVRDPPAGHEHEAERANVLVQRAVAIARAIHSSGGFYIIENPIDRSDAEMSKEKRLGYWPEHVALWQMEEMVRLIEDTGARVLHFPQCAVGGAAQKWTTLVYSPSLHLESLEGLVCSHSRSDHRFRHRRAADGTWGTASLAAYPPALNQALADAILRFFAERSEAVQRLLDRGDAVLARGDVAWWVAIDGSDVRPCEVVSVHFDGGDEPYYMVQFLDGSLRGTDGRHLRSRAPLRKSSDASRRPVVGSKRPHADVASASDAQPVPHEASSASLRRNESELNETLEAEPLPDVNASPNTDWFDPPVDTSVPGPLTTDQLIPAHVQRKLRAHRVRVQECYRRASAPSGWRIARDLRPEPLVFTEDEALLPAGRGWQWQQQDDGLWYPLTHSRWPEDPPESDLKIDNAIRGAAADPARFGAGDVGFGDQYVIASMAHGYEAPDLEPAAIIGYPHVGALKHMEAVHKCIDKDRRQDGISGQQPWTVHGGDLPQVWPTRADPINIVMRNGKARMTIDKTMRLSELFASYNEAVDLADFDPIRMVRVEQLGRAIAIMLTAIGKVRQWKFDLDSFFRRTGKQRKGWWKNSYLLPDGYAFDKRVQFGQREAPVLTSRQSNFLVWLIKREIWLFDRRFPPRDPKLQAWVLLRAALAGGSGVGSFSCNFTALAFVMCFVDDCGGSSIDDALLDEHGHPVLGRWHRAFQCYVPAAADHVGAVPMRRPDVHYAIALAVIMAVGHGAAAGKGEPPCLAMEILGVFLDIVTRQRILPVEKCNAYAEAAVGVIDAPVNQQDARQIPYDIFNSLVHKLLHSAATVVLGRQHVHYCMAALRAPNRLRTKAVLVFEPCISELRWWLDQFADPRRHCLPLASRVSFPFSDQTHTVVGYSDAARELDSPETSGFGAWTVFGDTVYYLAGLWESWELQGLSINVLELAAQNFSTFTLLAAAASCGRVVTHVLDFVDNTAAEYSSDRGRPHQADMQQLVRQRFDALDDAGVFSAVERIASVDNDWADGLSRGEERVLDVLRMIRASGLKAVRLEPIASWRDLSGLPGAPAAARAGGELPLDR